MRYRWFGLFVPFAISACAALPPPAPVASHYRLEGRISVRAAEQSFAGGIVWQSQGERQDILLRTPLGQGVAELRMDASGASLTDSAGTVHLADTGEALVQQAIGAALPLAGLAHWLRGRPDPSRPFIGQADGQGGWSSLEQDGWRIEYGRAFDGTRLPGRLTARRDDLEIRLVVDTWQTP
ncbi:MAG: outer membrane lipoprotein LolB [Betaproteobacteria bacterium]|nr:outer membrane lipoprotein LolB [Betaproteobacteria bacterium]